MVEIVYDDSKGSFKNLKIAGDFTDWKIEPMDQNSQKQWVYTIDELFLNKKEGKGSPKEIRVHFKFIDDDDNWLVMDEFDSEPDEHNNINNVKVITFKKIECEGQLPPLNSQKFEITNDGPESPSPSLVDASLPGEQTVDSKKADKNITELTPPITDDEGNSLNEMKEKEKDKGKKPQQIEKNPAKHAKVESASPRTPDHEQFHTPQLVPVPDTQNPGPVSSTLAGQKTGFSVHVDSPLNDKLFPTDKLNPEEAVTLKETNEQVSKVQRNDSDQYKSFLAKLLSLFAGLIKSWFGAGETNQQSEATATN